MLSETDKAYIAGFVDGEGHISIHYHSGKWSGHGVFVKITNTNLEVLAWIATHFGGALRKERNRKNVEGKGWKPTADVQWGARKAVEFLREIRPYLRLKARQADIVFEFAKTIRPDGATARPITPEEWDYREELRLQIRQLNLRANAEMPEAKPSPQLSKPVQTCPQCGKDFTSYRTRTYCSLACQQRSSMASFIARNHHTCQQCGKEFNGIPEQVFCSQSCVTKNMWETGKMANRKRKAAAPETA